MNDRREFTVIRCMDCGLSRPYPDGFPGVYATCWSCSWQDHLKSEHRSWWNRNIIKPARRAAKERYEREETDRRIAEARTELAAKSIGPEADR